MDKSVKKVEGKHIKNYKGCQIWLLSNGTYNVFLKGEWFPCPSIEFAKKFIDECKPNRKG